MELGRSSREGREGGEGKEMIESATGPSPPSRPSRDNSKLLQKPHIILVEQPDVADPIANHRDAFDAEAEGPAGPDFGIVADVFKHRGMHHAAAGDLEPFLAHLARERTAEI